jgi:hypothetical protein
MLYRTRGVVFALALLLLIAHAYPVLAADPMPPCPLAPQSRLRLEMAAVVAPGIDQLNLRALPALTMGIERQLYAGTALQIIGGPVCNDAFIWWRVELEGGARGWVAEATWRSFLILPADARVVSTPFEWSCPPRSPRTCPVAD